MNTHIPVFLASDDNYAPFVATTIASVCYNTTSFVHFYILNDDITLFHQRQIASLKKNFKNFDLTFIPLDTNQHFASLPFCNGLTKASYSRLLIPELAKDLEKAIYSDVDIISLGDIAELYEQDLGLHILGATDHACFVQDQALRDRLQNRLHLAPEHKYFYSGNLLLNCTRWRSQDITNQLFTLARHYNSHLTFGDQCLLNKFFDANKYKQLDYRFCLTTQDYFFFKRTDDEVRRKLMDNVVIRHFESSCKPWVTDTYRDGNIIPNFEDFWFFAEMTPFFAGLQQRFAASILRNTLPPTAPNSATTPKATKEDVLANLRNRIAATAKK